jgi:uncharacterized protein YcbX
MPMIGRIESLWRYPVKRMRGEVLEQVFLGFSGVYGDRLYAFQSAKAPKGFPHHTAREQEELLLFTPRFRDGEAAHDGTAGLYAAVLLEGIVCSGDPISVVA